MRNPVDLVGGFYTDDSLPWSCQDTVNYLPVQAEASGTMTMTKLVDAPGLRPWVWIGHTEAGTSSAPIRGMHDVEGQLFVVCGKTLYQISNKRVAIPLGTIPGVGRVSMAHNQRSTGNELIVVNGSGGYVWNTGTQTFSVVTDEGYPGASVVDFIDGYLMQVEPFGRFLFHSNLADALDYNTLDRFEAETAPDRTLGMIVNHQEVWAFGERTIDVFGNAGTAQGTFQNKGVSISRGCAAKWSPAVIDNGVAWLGDDLKVYHAVGYGPARISTRAIEVALSECSRADLRNAFSFVWEDLSHAVYYLTVPNGPTFGFDFSTRLWHRRASWHPERDIAGRWRVNDLVRHNGRWVGGDYQTGKLYELDWDYMLEGHDPLVRERVSPVAHVNGARFTVDSVEMLFETGGKASDGSEYQFPTQPTGPNISGDAPDSTIGVPYYFSYTVTPGDNPVTSVLLVAGSLPPGLVMSGSGVISGTPTAGGSFAWTVRAKDSIGLFDDQEDSAHIRSEQWWGVANGDFNVMYVSNDDALTWIPVTLNEDDIVSPHYGPVQFGGRVIFPIDAGNVTTTAYATPAAPPSVAVDVSLITVPSQVDRWRWFDGVGTASRRGGLPSMYTMDEGSSWAVAFSPPAGEAGDIARIGDRWVTYNRTVASRFYYSDDPEPINWIAGASAGGGHHVIASNGEVAVSFDNANSCRRTVDGAAWSTLTVASHGVGGSNGGDCIAMGDVFLFSRGDGSTANKTTLLRSADAGLTWAVVEVAPVTGTIRRFERSETGRVVASASGGSVIYYSDDLGLTWTAVATGLGTSRFIAAPVRFAE